MFHHSRACAAVRNNLIKIVECVSIRSIERKSRIVDLKTDSRTRHPRERALLSGIIFMQTSRDLFAGSRLGP